MKDNTGSYDPTREIPSTSKEQSVSKHKQAGNLKKSYQMTRWVAERKNEAPWALIDVDWRQELHHLPLFVENDTADQLSLDVEVGSSMDMENARDLRILREGK